MLHVLASSYVRKERFISSHSLLYL